MPRHFPSNLGEPIVGGSRTTTHLGYAGKIVSAYNVASGAVSAVFAPKASKTSRHRGSVAQNKMKYSKKKATTKKLATVTAVKRMISGVLEKKQQVFYGTVTFPLADNNIVFSTNLTAKIVQGSGDGQRVGDCINLGSLVWNATFTTAVKGTYYRYRVIVGFSGEEYNPAGITKTGLGATEVFCNSGSDTFTQVVNTKSFTAIYDNMLEINSLLDAVNDGKTLRGTIPLGSRKFEYQKAADTFGKIKNLYLVIVPSFNGVAPLDLGAVSFNSVLKFTDA